MRRLATALGALRRSDVARSIVGVGSATALSQLIALAVSPLLSRLYPQEVFGAFAAFFAFANILSVCCLAGLSDAVIAAQDDDEALALARIGSWVLAAALIPAAVLSLVSIDRNWFGLGILPRWAVWLIMGELIVLVAYAYLQALHVRFRRFKGISQAYLATGAARAGGQLAGGLGGIGLVGMGGGEFLGRLAAVAMMLRGIAPQLARGRRLAWARMWGVLGAYRHFPIARTPSAIASAVAVNAPPLMMVALYSAREAGLFALMTVALAAPLALIQRSVGDVFLGHFSHRFHADRAAAMALLWRVFLGLGLVAAAGGIVLLVAGPALFGLVFGARWTEAGVMAQVAVPMLVGQLLVLPIATAITVANRPEVKIGYDILYLGALALSWTVAKGQGLSAVEFVAWLSILTAAATAIFFGLVLWACANPRRLPAPSASAA